jgi:hypothetical protein
MGFKVALGMETRTQVQDEDCFQGVIASMGTHPLTARRMAGKESFIITA